MVSFDYMKLISLNAWGCRIIEPLFDFIKSNSETTDIFCFQEVLKGGKGKTHRDEVKSGYEEISRLLPNHTGYFSEYGKGGYYSENSKNLGFKYGIACFVRSDMKQTVGQGIDLYDPTRKWNDYSGRFAAGVALAVTVEDFAIINVHGMWQGSIKTDTEAKIEQSKKILDLAEKTDGRKIICGDFNVLPDTKSIQMLADKYTDLIREYGIKETRSSLYTKELRHAGFVFVDNKISVKDFSVPKMTVSDHLPMILEF
jgi:endonuclease/exonuclease/phosphatase family metal-dependent hydrolase